ECAHGRGFLLRGPTMDTIIKAPDPGDELLSAFRRYCVDGTVLPLSRGATDYAGHCLGRAMRAGAAREERKLAVSHHPLFARRAAGAGHPGRIGPFMIAIAEACGASGDAPPGPDTIPAWSYRAQYRAGLGPAAEEGGGP